jgi:hypothetical protein
MELPQVQLQFENKIEESLNRSRDPSLLSGRHAEFLSSYFENAPTCLYLYFGAESNINSRY